MRQRQEVGGKMSSNMMINTCVVLFIKREAEAVQRSEAQHLNDRDREIVTGRRKKNAVQFAFSPDGVVGINQANERRGGRGASLKVI